jgi:beta-galactosidase
VRDVQDMVRRDRNHPSIVLWSIGNEIDYPGDPFGHPRGHDGLKPGMMDAGDLPPVARRLIGAVKSIDGTRPVTQALADTLASNATGLASLLDVTGYNYLEQYYAADHAMWPQRLLVGSENSHSLPAWRAVAQNDYVLGQFLWTGIDYLGESRAYPARGSGSGLLDLCGFRKPDSYLREALWGDRPMVYAAAREPRPQTGPKTDFDPDSRGGPLAEHWNWAGDARTAIPVEVYTNAATAELFLNGRSLGEKAVASPLDPVLRWDVPFAPGVLRVEAKRDGREVAHFELATAGPADHLELVADPAPVHAGAAGLAQIEIRAVDAAGHRVATAALPVDVVVSGAGELAAIDNADLLDTAPVQARQRKLYQGRALALVRSTGGAGKLEVTASAPGVKPATLALSVE